MKSEQEELAHYTRLLGLNEAIKLLRSREKDKIKRERLLKRSRTEKQATSYPDGRLNAGNLASRSLVGAMGGKRKPKKTKRGF